MIRVKLIGGSPVRERLIGEQWRLVKSKAEQK